MATFKLLALTFTILYFFAFSTARISIPLNVQPKNVVINRDNDATVSDRVFRPSFKRRVFLPTPDHEPSDKVLGVELDPEVFDQHNKHYEQKSSDPKTVELTKFNNNDLNDDHKASDAITIELEMERPNHMTLSKNKEPGVSDQDMLIKEPHESDQDFPIKESHESDHDLPVKEQHESEKDIPVLSENTISIETLNLNPSNYFRIRPINRHFRVKPSLFRIHRCRHHMNHANQNNHQTPYGNDMVLTRDDMVLAGQTKERFDPSTLHISSQSDQEKRPMTHHHHHHDEDKNMMTRRPFRQYIARQKLKKKVEEEIQKRKEMDARKQGGFMKSFRKFLNQF